MKKRWKLYLVLFCSLMLVLRGNIDRNNIWAEDLVITSPEPALIESPEPDSMGEAETVQSPEVTEPIAADTTNVPATEVTISPSPTQEVKVKCTDVSLNQNSIIITGMENYRLLATVRPSNATNQKIIWSSSNTSVATVDNNGVVRGYADGYAIIMATTEDGGYCDECRVTVTGNDVESVSLNKS